MDELKAETVVPQGSAITLQMYGKAEVDNYIKELKAKNTRLFCVARNCILNRESCRGYDRSTMEGKIAYCAHMMHMYTERKSRRITELERQVEMGNNAYDRLLEDKRKADAELAQLKEQLRWMEFEKEQPTEPGYYNVSDGKDSYMEWGCYNLVDDRWMWDHGAAHWKYWRPMPKGPEECK